MYSMQHCNIYNIYGIAQISSVVGIAVSITAFQAVDPGSTPSHRNPILRMNLKYDKQFKYT